MSEAKTHDIKCLISLIQFVYYARWQKLFFPLTKNIQLLILSRKDLIAKFAYLLYRHEFNVVSKKKRNMKNKYS